MIMKDIRKNTSFYFQLILFAASFHSFHASASENYPLEGSEIRQLFEHRAVHYEYLGQPYGIEFYIDHNTVIWQHADGFCEKGNWQLGARSACYAYPSDEACWEILKHNRHYIARVVNGEDPGFSVNIIKIDDTKPICGVS